MSDPSGHHAFSAVSVNVDAYPVGPQLTFGFRSVGMRLHNAGTEALVFSADGVADHGRLGVGEAMTLRDFLVVGRLFFRREAAGAAVNTVYATLWG